MNTEKIKWCILVTGWGRNARDTIQAYRNKKLSGSKIALLIFEQNPCGAAELAQQYGIETLQLLRKDFDSIAAYQQQLLEVIQSRNIDFVFMLNYKYRIRKPMLEALPNRILNIHPSLFPSFLGTKTAIQDAISYGVKITGITTHIIDQHLDRGRIVCQTAIRIKETDTLESLYPKFAKKGRKIILKTIQEIERTLQKKVLEETQE